MQTKPLAYKCLSRILVNAFTKWYNRHLTSHGKADIFNCSLTNGQAPYRVYARGKSSRAQSSGGKESASERPEKAALLLLRILLKANTEL